MSWRDFVRERAWERRDHLGRAAWLGLYPLSFAFRAAAGLRSFAYWSRIAPIRRAPIPVVSVGNVTVGGTGKTPLALWIARSLGERGSRVALVSRGYGGSASGVTTVFDGGTLLADPSEVGDEPVMMAKSFDGVIITSARRIDGVRRAAELGCEVAVLDDGFQHRALARDFDIVVHDGTDGPLLPAGPMRERLSAMCRADAVVLTPSAADRPLAVDGAKIFRMTMELTGLVESVEGVWQERTRGCLAGKRVIAVVGIANPERFYQTIHGWDATIEDVYAFADHHVYTRSDWQEISRRSQECDLVVTTEKDLVKLEAFPFARGKLMALRVEPRLDDGARLLSMIEESTVLRGVASASALGYQGSRKESVDGDQ